VLAAASPSNTGLIYDFLRNELHAGDIWAHTGQVVLARMFRILLVIVLAVVVSRLGGSLVRRAVGGLRLRVGSGDSAARAEDRVRTVGAALASAFRAAVWVIAVLTIMGELGIQLGPFVAGATIVGAALGFGAQSLVRDFLSGFLILVEDQYGVGDLITVNDTTGTVESLNFRTTRLRAVDGVVWYIPNGEIRKVGNSSDEFNRALIDVVLPWPVDVDRAVEVITAAAGAVAGDAAYRDSILSPPDVWGVDTISAEGLTIRVAVKTVPAGRAAIGRALRGRIVAELQAANLGWSRVGAEGVEGTDATQ
jgi:small-conductance mechanosensitive channel